MDDSPASISISNTVGREGLYVTGMTSDVRITNGQKDILILKFKMSDGSLEWFKSIGRASDDIVGDTRIDPVTSTLLIAAHSNSQGFAT